jgi:hypothetical protein
LLITKTGLVRHSPSQMSLLAELELQAFWHGDRISVAPLELAGRKAGTIYSYERRLLGLRLGIRHGVMLLDAAPERLPIGALADQVSDAAPADLATYRIAGPAGIDLADRTCVVRARQTTSVTVALDTQEVLALGPSFDAFVESLGRSTRRNHRACRRVAAEAAIRFGWSTEGPATDPQELKQLCRCNMPTPSSARHISRMHRFISGKPRCFHATMRSAGGQLISAAGGFLEGDLALLLYQYNHSGYRALNPSLMMRSFMIERLCDEAIRRLAFVGKCSGLLLHACEPALAAEMLIMRNSVRSRLKKLACRIGKPAGKTGRLLASSADLMID